MNLGQGCHFMFSRPKIRPNKNIFRPSRPNFGMFRLSRPKILCVSTFSTKFWNVSTLSSQQRNFLTLFDTFEICFDFLGQIRYALTFSTVSTGI